MHDFSTTHIFPYNFTKQYQTRYWLTYLGICDNGDYCSNKEKYMVVQEFYIFRNPVKIIVNNEDLTIHFITSYTQAIDALNLNVYTHRKLPWRIRCLESVTLLPAKYDPLYVHPYVLKLKSALKGVRLIQCVPHNVPLQFVVRWLAVYSCCLYITWGPIC